MSLQSGTAPKPISRAITLNSYLAYLGGPHCITSKGPMMRGLLETHSKGPVWPVPLGEPCMQHAWAPVTQHLPLQHRAVGEAGRTATCKCCWLWRTCCHEVLELVVVDPGVPHAITEEALTPRQQDAAAVRMLACKAILTCAPCTRGARHQPGQSSITRHKTCRVPHTMRLRVDWLLESTYNPWCPYRGVRKAMCARGIHIVPVMYTCKSTHM
jgi:hypothetical protein